MQTDSKQSNRAVYLIHAVIHVPLSCIMPPVFRKIFLWDSIAVMPTLKVDLAYLTMVKLVAINSIQRHVLVMHYLTNEIFQGVYFHLN